MEKALSSLGLKGRSTRDLTQTHREYPADSSQYELLEDCGRGVSATVHRAKCKQLESVCAVKRLNLESMNCDLDEIIHEAHTMKSYNHPNVLSLYTSFVNGQELWMVMPFMSGGSVLHIMKYAYPEGLDEVAIATIARDVLRGLEYVHKNGGIHRDVKAGNILVDMDGTVKLGDFGVAATLERGGSWGNSKCSRNTFVGTPCWMAPEVMEQNQGYGAAADIWSLGITLLELAHGHAPFAKFPPMKVLLMTLQNPPPTLDDKGGKKHFSKNMRDVVSRCLQKDPSRRPTATALLEHKFFKQGRDEEYLARYLLAGLPPLPDRVQQIRSGTGKAATSAEENNRRYEASQDEYIKGVSSWNFDIAALKAQAAMQEDANYLPSMPTIPEGPEMSYISPSPSAPMSPTPSTQRARAPSLSGDEAPAMTSLPPLHRSSVPAGPVPASTSGSSPQVDEPWPVGKGPGDHQVGTAQALVNQKQASPAPVPASQDPRPRQVSAFAVPSAASMRDIAAAAAPRFDYGAGPSLTENGPSTAPTHTGPSHGPVTLVQFEGPGSNDLGTVHSEPSGVPPGMHGSSPLMISREGSSVPPREGSFSAVPSAGTTPTAAASIKAKHGRFKVYEEGEPIPPMSPPGAPTGFMEHAQTATVASLARVSFQGSTVPPEQRLSDDGAKAAEEKLVAMVSETLQGEQVEKAKQRGRFKIIEESEQSTNKPPSRPVSKAPSSANLADAATVKPLRSEASSKSVPAASPAMSAGNLLPKLQELLEHTTSHQTAIQKLIQAVQEGDKTRGLTRSISIKTLAENAGNFANAIPGPSPASTATVRGPDPQEQMDRMFDRIQELEKKVAVLEEENIRLRHRNIEPMVTQQGSSSTDQVDTLQSPAKPASRRPSGGGAVAPLLSPGMTPRPSQEEENK